MTEKEFRDTLYFTRVKIEDRDVDKLIQKYINNVGHTIDTNVMVEHMHQRVDTHREYSSAKAIRKVVDKDIITKVAKKLDKEGLVKKVIRNFEDFDEKKTGYLSFDDIKHAFHKANFKLATSQVKEMLTEVKQNRDGEYKYHILLCSLFGDDYKHEIKIDGKTPQRSRYGASRSKRRDSRASRTSEKSYKSRSRDPRDKSLRDRSPRGRSERDRSEKDRTKSRHRSEKSSPRRGERSERSRRDEKSMTRSRDERKSRRRDEDTRSRKRDEQSSKSRTRGAERDRDRRHRDAKSGSRFRSRSRAPLGKQAKAIGKRLENSRYEYIEHLKHFAGDDKDYILTSEQVYKLLDAARIKLTKEEKEDFKRDMGGETKFTVEEFLINCNLDAKAFGGEKLDVAVVLSPEEKDQALALLGKIGKAIEDEKKEFERIFNIGPYDKQVEFAEFKYGIENELNDDCAKIAADMRSINLLKTFLVENINKDDKVDVKFLYTSLFPGGDGKPEIKSKMNCVTDFIEFIKSTPDVDFEKDFPGMMTHEEFEKKLDEVGFEISNENMTKLKEVFSNSKEPDKISKNLIKRNINLLAPDFLNKGAVATRKEVTDRLAHLDPKIKNTLTKISTYLKRERMDTLTFFNKCDEDGDGVLTADEFCEGVLSWKIVGMKDRHLREAYEAMNTNKDDTLTLGEIWMYIEGAKPTEQERNAVLERELTRDMEEQINDLFNEFKDESKSVTKESVQRILTAYSIPSNVIAKTLGNIRTDKDGKISKKDFKKYMIDFLKESILEVENDINELRAMFYEADLNNSGFLDMDELYNLFNIKLEANITREELRTFVQSVDIDFDGELDIDEFIALMTKNPAEKGASGSAQATYMRIKKSRKFDMTEFVKFLKKFPDHFQESFSAKLYRNKHCLPSSVFMHNIIPHDEQSLKVSKKVKAEPTIKTSDPLIAAQILLEGARGISHPEEDKISIEEVTKHVVRATIYDFDSRKFIGNSTFIIASYNPRYKDQWKFNKWSETGTNPLIFRTEMLECQDKNICIIFEFVIYCKQDKDTIKELN